MNLGLPSLDSPVPLSSGILPAHVRSLWHGLTSRLLGNLLDVGFIVIRPLAVLDLLLSPGQDGGVRLHLQHRGLTSSLSVGGVFTVLVTITSTRSDIVVGHIVGRNWSGFGGGFTVAGGQTAPTVVAVFAGGLLLLQVSEYSVDIHQLLLVVDGDVIHLDKVGGGHQDHDTNGRSRR